MIKALMAGADSVMMGVAIRVIVITFPVTTKPAVASAMLKTNL